MSKDVQAGRIYIPVDTNAKQASNDAERLDKVLNQLDASLSKLSTANTQAQGATQKHSQAASVLGGVIKAIPFAAVAAGIRSAVTAADEAQRVEAQLSAVIRSTGAAAGFTTREMLDLAGALSEKNGVDDEAIGRSEALMLTFTKVGKDVIPKAEQAIIDLSAAMGTDLQGATIQVGKALNDPIQGVSALQRVGASFDATQKKQIENFVKTNQLAKAQGIVIAELQKEFGGTAEAMKSMTVGGAFNTLSIKVANMLENVGEGLTPAMIDFADAISLAVAEGGVLYNVFDALGKIVTPVIRGWSLLMNAVNTAGNAGKMSAIQDQMDNVTQGYKKLDAEMVKYYGKSKTLSELEQESHSKDNRTAEVATHFLKTAIQLRTASTKVQKDYNAAKTEQEKIEATNERIINGTTKKEIDARRKARDELERQMIAHRKNKVEVVDNTEAMKLYREALKMEADAGDFVAVLKVMDLEFDENKRKLDAQGVSTEFLRRRYEQLREQAADKIYIDVIQRVKANNNDASFEEQQTALESAAKAQQSQIQSAYDQRQATIDAAYNSDRITEEQYQAQSLANEQAYFANMIQNHEAYNKRSGELTAEESKNRLQASSQILSSVSNLVSGTVSAMSEYSNAIISNMQETMQAEGKSSEEIAKAVKKKRREMAQKEKAGKIATIILNTAAGVTGALAHSGEQTPALAIAQAAAIGALGAVQLGYAMATPIVAAFGGNFSVKPGYEGDGAFMRVSSGENVSVTPARYSDTGQGGSTYKLQIGKHEFDAAMTSSVNQYLNSGAVQIRKRGAVKSA